MYDVGKFSAKNSMGVALGQMIDFIQSQKTHKIAYCEGCIAHEICSECMLTQSHALNLQEYMNHRCQENLRLIADYFSANK